ncbi:hypothetical protein HPB47_004337 [Ixodes persulcatus]|uniref:Uncharacterized protein n=1 Tax=Ixodes persulcatus TaxID=34615 RepID=A0AC60PG92_IXOPE|nr:hypothetical protein HPB47_004337 [Ixodes persulcatus]
MCSFFFNVNCCHFDIELLHGSIHHISAGTQRDVIKLGKLKNLLQSEFVFRLVYLADRDVYSLPREEKRNISKLYNKMPLNGLKKLAPQIDWDRYFNSLLVDKESKGAAAGHGQLHPEEFMAILDDIDWMDEQTRQRARAKAQAIQPYIGYPEELLKDVLVEEHYSKVTLKPDAYFENVMRLRKWSTDYALGQLRKPHIKGDWKRFAQVAVVDAYYSDVENCIRIPAGILQGVFFSKDRPSYLNYGAIGSIIGHEITHGFDDEGRQFDKDGSIINWWEPETDLKFRQRAQCIVEQYGNYTVAEGTMNVNGINTQGENIADNGGIKEAFNAYKKWVKENGPEAGLPGLKYTPQQLFWISAANIWCSKYRPEALKLSILAGAHSPAPFSRSLMRLLTTVSPVDDLTNF